MNHIKNKETGYITVTPELVQRFIDKNMMKICSNMNKNMDLTFKRTSKGLKMGTVKY